MLGFNSQQVFKDEVGALSGDRRDIEFDLGDYIRQGYGALIGKDYSKDAIRKGAAEILEDQINQNTSAQQQTIRESLGGTGFDVSDLDIQPGQTEKDYRSKLAGLEARGNAALTYRQTENSDPRKITNGMSTGDILALTTDQTISNRNANEKKVTDRADELRFEMYEREDRRDLRQEKQLAQDRALQADTNRMQMQLEYARLEQADRNRAQDRQDKALMTLLQGLGNLGMAFTL